jgi:sulfhydrogenase subunit beta (sulfur reductase)
MPQKKLLLERTDLDALIAVLGERGYRVMGPTVQGGAVVLGELAGTSDLPVGYDDEQEAGTYRLKAGDGESLFRYVVGPSSPKGYLHPPEAVVWAGTRDSGGFEALPLEEPPRYAFFGVRPCELAAVSIQDRVFLDGRPDPVYAPRRESALFIVVNCVEPGGTCFCASMGTGPRADSGFDVALTEMIDAERHVFLAESGSQEGVEMLSTLGAEEASKDDLAEADRLLSEAASRMGRSLDAAGAKGLLERSLDSPHWEEVAKRCLTCANCTLVCPTCFCFNVEDSTDLTGFRAERVRRWDSCFNFEFSSIHGGPLRSSTAGRYRQWITHKLAWWHDQYGTSGCVGCGRCITWCPVGIDITAEMMALRAKEESNA